MPEEFEEFLISIGIDPTMDEDIIEEKVGDYLVLNCLDENYKPNKEGEMCYQILYYLA